MEFFYIKNSKISDTLLFEIIELKNVHWKFTQNEHLSWIRKNLKNNDVHVLMYNGKALIGYLNLVKCPVIIDKKRYFFYGLGNLSVSEKGKGHGKILLHNVNDFLLKANKTGILFCKDSTIDFYLKCKWSLIKKEYVNANFKLFNTMVFNLSSKLSNKIILIEKEF